MVASCQLPVASCQLPVARSGAFKRAYFSHDFIVARCGKSVNYTNTNINHELHESHERISAQFSQFLYWGSHKIDNDT
jgi:hypothetical protein